MWEWTPNLTQYIIADCPFWNNLFLQVKKNIASLFKIVNDILYISLVTTMYKL